MKALAHRNQNQNAKKSVDLHNTAITEINNNQNKNSKNDKNDVENKNRIEENSNENENNSENLTQGPVQDPSQGFPPLHKNKNTAKSQKNGNGILNGNHKNGNQNETKI